MYNIQLRAEQLPTSAVHRRSACTIALRFPDDLKRGQVTRVQFKFACVEDFDQVTNYFDRIDIQMSAAPARHITSAGSEGLPSIRQPIVAVGDPARHSSTSMHNGAKSEGMAAPSLPSVLSVPELNRPMKFDFFQDQARNDQLYAPSIPQRLPVTPTDLDFPRPASGRHLHSLYPISENLDSNGEVGGMHKGLPAPAAPEAVIARPFIETIDRPTTAGPYHAVASTSVASHISPGAHGFPQPGPPVPTYIPQHRPSTAPLEALEQDLSAMIPPRRELPFSRPSSLKGRRTSFALDLPPLPKPKMRGQTTPKESSLQREPAVKTKNNEAPDAPQKRPASSDPKASIKQDVKPPAKRRAKSTKSKANEVPQIPSSVTLCSSPPKKSEENTITGAVAPQQQQQPPSVLGVLNLLSAAHERLDATTESLARYVTQPRQVREHAVEALVLQLLQDENYCALVEDIEGCWRRIGLERQRNGASTYR